MFNCVDKEEDEVVGEINHDVACILSLCKHLKFFKTEHGCWSRNMAGFPVEEIEISFLNT